MSGNNLVIQSDIIASRNNDGSVVAMKADDSDLFYKITGVSTTVWDYIEQGHDIDKMVQLITDEYNAEPEIVKKDIESFILDLKKFNILE